MVDMHVLTVNQSIFLTSLKYDKEPTCRPTGIGVSDRGLFFFLRGGGCFLIVFILIFFGICSIYTYEKTTFYFGKDFLNFCLVNGMGYTCIIFISKFFGTAGLCFISLVVARWRSLPIQMSLALSTVLIIGITVKMTYDLIKNSKLYTLYKITDFTNGCKLDWFSSFKPLNPFIHYMCPSR